MKIILLLLITKSYATSNDHNDCNGDNYGDGEYNDGGYKGMYGVSAKMVKKHSECRQTYSTWICHRNRFGPFTQ